jgi:GWxTD domain-containing protein
MDSGDRRMRGVLTLMSAAVLVAILCLTGLAQDERPGPRLWSDYAAFRLEPDSPDAYVEFYFEMKRVDFVFRDVDGTLRADVYTWIHVTDTTGTPVDSIGGEFVSVVADSTEVADSTFILFFARYLILPPGDYQAQAVVADLMSQATTEVRYPVVVPDFSTNALNLSNIELGYNIVDKSGDTLASRHDVLVKNTQKVYPDCRGLVGPSRPRLLFYSEVYNFDFDPAQDNSYTLELSILNEAGQVAYAEGMQTLTKPGRDAVLATGINVGNLDAGLYTLNLAVTDPASGQTVSAQKRFEKVVPQVAALTPEEADRIRDIIAYVAHPDELSAFDRLNPVGQRNFWDKFWRDRDPTPGTPENEAKDEHLRRMNYANERFSVGFSDRSDGWRTDMGRVYIVHGPPDHVERYPYTLERPAAEMWFYDQLPNQGQAYFLFIDEGGYGEYNMVHSTARGERRDPYWERQVRDGAFERTQ